MGLSLRPMSPQLKLPTEICISIASLLAPADLTRLCRTSSLYLSITRPILYRSVNLPGVESTFKTLTLLSTNTSLAEDILQLTISPPVFDSEPNLLEALLEALPLLTNMKKLSIVENAIFPRGQKRFLEIMKEKNPPLEEFSYTESEDLIMLHWDAGQLNLDTFTGLKKISWSFYINQRVAAPNNSRAALFEVLFASIETIESIAIDPYVWSSADFLWGMRFPALKRLEFRSVWIFPGEIPFPLSKFLNAHPGIEELRIGLNRYHVKGDEINPWTWGKVMMNNSDYTNSELPISLRSYTGSIEGFIGLFARKNGLYCLSDSLEELVFELDEGYSGDLGEKIRLLNRVFRESGGVLGNLKRLDFPLMHFEYADYYRFPKLFLDDGLEIARLCAPTVEYYRGPVPKSYDELLSFLTSFPHLKELHVCAHHVWGRQVDRLEENEREEIIAKVCEFLERIVVISDYSDFDIICWKEVVRSKPGNGVLRIETYWQPRTI